MEIRVVLCRVERRADARAGDGRRDERRLDGGDRLPDTAEQQQSGAAEVNYEAVDMRPWLDVSPDSPWVSRLATASGVDWPTYRREAPGMSAFALEDGVVYHAYSAYARGIDGLWGMYQWLDRAPRGRNETDVWWRRHDEYDG
ncbi:MAG TPA: DUF899 family protein [Trebonia sp.]|jgi:predicted dithiol-disulfide oxidoreductase (DUF899 family)|nr:DUF899 family protein [Trebonia sp.]